MITRALESFSSSISAGFHNLQECLRKQTDYQKQTKEASRVYDQECAKLGIDKSANLRNELINLARNIPAYFDEIAGSSKKLAAPVDYYIRFRHYVAMRLRCALFSFISGFILQNFCLHFAT